MRLLHGKHLPAAVYHLVAIQVKMMNLMIRPLHLSEKKVKNKTGEQKQDGL